MRKGIRSLGYGIPFAAALVAGSASDAYSQVSGYPKPRAADTAAKIDSQKPKQGIRSKTYTDAGNDFGLLHSYVVRAEISPSKPFKFDVASDRPIRHTVFDAKEGVDSLVKELNSNWYFTPITRGLREYWKNFAKTVQPSDSASVAHLNKALTDRVISPDEIYSGGKYQFKEGNYWVTIQSGNEKKRMLVYLDLPDTPTAAEYNLPSPTSTSAQAPQTGVAQSRPTTQRTGTSQTRAQTPRQAQDSTKIRAQADSVARAGVLARLRARQEKARQDSVARADSIANAARVPSGKDSSKYVPPVTPDTGKAPAKTGLESTVDTNSTKSRDWRLSADAIYPVLKNEMNLMGGQFGVRYRGVGLLFNYSTVADSVTKDITVPLSNGRQGIGKETETGMKSVGIGLEFHPWHFFAGAGINAETYTVKAEEDIVSPQGNSLKPVVNSKGKFATSQRYWGGVEANKGRMGLRVFGGYDTKRGKFAGVGVSARLNRKQDRR